MVRGRGRFWGLIWIPVEGRRSEEAYFSSGLTGFTLPDLPICRVGDGFL